MTARWASVLVLAGIAHAGPEAREVTAPSALPWVVNFDELAATTADARGSALPLDMVGDADPSCAGTAYGALALRANLGGGTATLVASYAHGVIVADAEGHTIATAPGYPCYGTADDLDAIAVGRAWGSPMIALVLTTGGRREAMTWVGFYRMGRDGRLEATFSGAVEQFEDGVIRRGQITLLPGAIVHTNPTGETVLWVYHPVIGVYLPYPLGTAPHG